MKAYRKMLALKSCAVLLCACIMAFYLTEAQGYGLYQCIQVVFGGRPQYFAAQKAAFFMFSILVQFFCADTLVYFVKNHGYLAVRYGSRGKTATVMCLRLVYDSLILSVVLSCGIALGNRLGNNCFDPVSYCSLFWLWFRCALLCLILILLQGILLTRLTPAGTFAVISAAVICISFASCRLPGPVTVLPVGAGCSPETFIQAAADAVVICAEVAVLRSLLKKELWICQLSY